MASVKGGATVSRVLLTGANRGLGLEFSRQLAERGDEVIATCRRSGPDLERLGLRVESQVDMASLCTIDDLRRRLEGQSIDLLILNAGIMERVSLESLDLDAIRRQFEINSLAPLYTARAFMDCMPPGSKIALITSLMGSMGDNGSGGSYGYRMSKAAANAAGVSLARDLQSQGIAVGLLHPGMVATDMTGNRGMSVDESVRGMLERIDALTLATSGRFMHSDGRELSW
jgi:NAD(P)-dependent dehydrogenase (short-subunit alcohol dehydrogenase family)